MGIGGSDMYRQQILDHYKNPRNFGEIEEATFTHVGENPMCGDTIEMDIVLDDADETIERVAFRGDALDGLLCVVENDIHLDGVAAHRILADVGERGLLDLSEVARVLVVVEDLLSVHVRAADTHRWQVICSTGGKGFRGRASHTV